MVPLQPLTPGMRFLNRFEKPVYRIRIAGAQLSRVHRQVNGSISGKCTSCFAISRMKTTRGVI